jgi:predicted GNAT family acetyltransferase
MRVKTYADPALFLQDTQAELESNEAANSLMLGICGQLIDQPERFRASPCLKTLESESGLMLAALMTPPHKLVVFAHQGNLDDIARVLVDNLIEEGWRIPGVLGPSTAAQSIAARWSEATGNQSELEQRQSVYELREVPGQVPDSGRLRLAIEQDTELVAHWWYGFHNEVFGQATREASYRAARERIANRDIYLLETDRPVSIAMQTRPTRNGVSISLVYTPLEMRGQGYATACVGLLSRMLLEAGRGYCALFVNHSNTAAKRVYQKIGYKPACDYDEYVFRESERKSFHV